MPRGTNWFGTVNLTGDFESDPSSSSLTPVPDWKAIGEVCWQSEVEVRISSMQWYAISREARMKLHDLLQTSWGRLPIVSLRSVWLLLLPFANQFETSALSSWLPNYPAERKVWEWVLHLVNHNYNAFVYLTDGGNRSYGMYEDGSSIALVIRSSSFIDVSWWSCICCRCNNSGARESLSGDVESGCRRVETWMGCVLVNELTTQGAHAKRRRWVAECFIVEI